MAIELRPYQIHAVEGVRQAMREGHRRVILHLSTGSGKTECAFEVIRAAQAKGKTVAFLANRIHLVDQCVRRLALAGFDCGVIQGKNTNAPWRKILVCSVQTVAKRGLPDVDILIIDECHAAAGTKGYREVMVGKPCLGLTATPYSKGLGKHYDELGGPLFETVVVGAKITDLIRDGYLVSADVWAPSEPDLANVRTVAGDYHEGDLAEAMDKPVLIGDIVQHWFKLSYGEPTVVFASSIAHSKHIVEQFRAADITAEHLDCYTTDADRIAILERVTQHKTMVISNVGVLAEGWDFPACKTLILARPTKSLIRYLQMAGRVLRPYPDKPRALILDHAGVVRRLGFPWDDFSQPLDDGKPKTGASKKDREEPLPKPCPKCAFMKPPRTPICPACGHEAVPPSGMEYVDGELVPLTKRAQQTAPAAVETMGKQSVYSQLLRIQADRGYSSGWTAHKYKEIFGVWPRGLIERQAEPTGALLALIRKQAVAYAKTKRGFDVLKVI